MDYRMFVLCLLGLTMCAGAARRGGRRTSKMVQIRYACKPNGDISAFNPLTDYQYVYSYNDLGPCNTEMLKEFKVIKITGCPQDNEPRPVKVILSKKKFRTPMLIGGRNHKIGVVRCEVDGRSNMVQIDTVASMLYRDISGFSKEFHENPHDVTIEMYDVMGDSGYNIFSLSYPIGLTITGPMFSEIYPEICVAYPTTEEESPLKTPLAKDGCSMEHGLMFSFSKEEADWFERNITIDYLDYASFMLDKAHFHDHMMGLEEYPFRTPPMLYTHVYAFRFYLSGLLTIQCDIRVCPEDSPDCELPCDPADITTTVQPVSTTSKPATTESESLTESVTESESLTESETVTESMIEGDDERRRKKRDLINVDHILYNSIDQVQLDNELRNSIILGGLDPLDDDVDDSEAFIAETVVHVKDKKIPDPTSPLSSSNGEREQTSDKPEVDDPSIAGKTESATIRMIKTEVRVPEVRSRPPVMPTTRITVKPETMWNAIAKYKLHITGKDQDQSADSANESTTEPSE